MGKASSLVRRGASKLRELHPSHESLLRAVIAGDAVAATSLLGRGAKVSVRSKSGSWDLGCNVLMVASLGGDVQMVKVLLNHGASVLAADSQGNTALHEASAKGCLDVVHVLLHHGARSDARDSNGFTALHKSIMNGHSAVTKLLLPKRNSRDFTDADADDFIALGMRSNPPEKGWTVRDDVPSLQLEVVQTLLRLA